MGKSFITEPLNVFTGGQGAGKTLFAVEQADMLRNEKEPAAVFQVNIRDPDTRYLPNLPFDVHEMAFKDGEPVRDEQGNHLPRWAVDLPKPCVIIIDEAHKVFPQRGPGRPPRSIEAMAESRYESVRWLLLTQAPGSLDAFLRDRVNVHWHIERKGGLNQATLYQFDNRVVDKSFIAQQKRYADGKQVRRYPKKYFGWYKSAKSHHFGMRLPLKVWLGFLAIPAVFAVGYYVITTVTGFMNKDVVPGVAGANAAILPAGGLDGGAPAVSIATTAATYLQQFQPLIASMPWSAPAFQGDDIRTRPELYCIASGHDGKDGCRCFTEQATPYAIEIATCQFIARNGVYNPHRPQPEGPRGTGSGDRDDKREKPSHSASRVRPDPAVDQPGPVAGDTGVGVFRS